jgi:cation transport ATPase
VARVRRTKLFALPEMRWAALASELFLTGLVTQVAVGPHWIWWALYLGCYISGGREPGLAGLQALRDITLDVDLLMVAAAIGAAGIGQITDGALLIVIFATSGALEALATVRTQDSVRGLLDLAPETVTRVSGEGGEETVNAADLNVGDVLVVRPGERIKCPVWWSIPDGWPGFTSYWRDRSLAGLWHHWRIGLGLGLVGPVVGCIVILAAHGSPSNGLA